MITALDTNVPSALWSGIAQDAASVAETLNRISRDGSLIVCGVVYAELLAYPGATQDFLDRFLSDTRIAAEFETSASLWREAGARFAKYAQRRRRSGGAEPKRLLADFVVGAHALLQAGRLFTLDPGRYRRDFPELQLL